MSVGIKFTPTNPVYRETTRVYYEGEATEIGRDLLRGTMHMDTLNAIFPSRGKEHIELSFGPEQVVIEFHGISSVQVNGASLRSADRHIVRLGAKDVICIKYGVEYLLEVFPDE